MKFSSTFSELNKKDANIAGGKGASLGEMTQAGIPVPPGFVVLSTTFDYFLKETDLTQEIQAILEKVDPKAIHTIEDASEKIRGLIENKKVPEDIAQDIQNQFEILDSDFVAVRSSATAEDGAEHAWAGQLDSFLNTDKNTLLENVKRCWSSLFTPRAIFYRFEKGLHGTDISVAVVVQKMVQSEISGIAFSVHPVTEDRNQLIVEAGFGLGEAIVSGSITPDSYVVEKTPRKIIDINVSTQTRGLFRNPVGGNEWKEISEPQASSQVLNKDQILELADLIIKIENHYGFPCDIEWAYESKKFCIVQSRPITTLSNKSEDISKTVLSKVFSREKTLFYFSMWNDSDRMGWKNFLNYEVKNNLFIIPSPGQKGSVWYSQKELSDIDNLLRQELQNNPDLISRFKETLDTNWDVIFPYLSDNKKLSSIEEFENYYKHLVQWWSAMNTAFGIPDMQEVSEEIRRTFLSYRTESEKYTEKMNKVLIVFWNEHFPDLHDFTFYTTPIEVAQISSDPETLSKIKERKDGCFMLNGEIYPLKELDQKLSDQNLSLERISIEDEQVIKGNIAYQGKVIGKVRKIMSFKDMKNFQSGEILVTEMTNPDYLPIMKIAAAVVTDEGGATCHAAIASRELKIPCIVGTKIATQVLKDGMEIEVDADNGIVKILQTKPTLLSKYMTREHSIFYASIWDEANRSHWDKYFLAKNIKNMVFLVDSEKMLEVYYDLPELDATLKEVGDGVVKNPEIADKIISDFKKSTETLTPYFEGKKKIQNTKELEIFHKTLLEWWMGLEHVFVVPDQMQVSEDIRKKMLKLREETQDYSDVLDRPYMDFIKEKYPQFAKYAHILKPEEAYRIEELNKDEIQNIEERLNGCILATIQGQPMFFQGGNLVKQLLDKGINLADSSINLQFKKIYTRDTTYIMQELWAYGCSEGIKKEFGWKNPYLPGIIHYMNQGSIEIWENLKATEWLEHTILEKNITDQKFIDVVLDTYKKRLAEIHPLWKKKTLSLQDLKKLINLSKEALSYFIPYYYSAVNERTPKEIREKALEMRNKDEFFAENDMVIRDSITALYPEIKGYETTIFFDELDSIPPMNILKERREHSLIVQGKEKYIESLLDFERSHPEYRFISDEFEDTNLTEIKGEIAQKGKVVGRVKIVRRRDQVGEVQEGDIIVSPMTTPDFLPAMKIAGAFVTDEGGITCHAGIVARELKKPCVIGTKIATQVLKDGMKVEVDADLGIIKIIK